jgi:hypothetical protein
MFATFILVLFYRYDRVTASLWIRYPGILLGECYNWHLYACILFCGYETPTTASHPHLFQTSIVDEEELRKLVASSFLPDRVVLQWCPTTGEDILTPNTNEIVVFSSFFQHGLGLPACDFLR